MSINWNAVWLFFLPILKQALIAALVALLAILGYDHQVLPQRLRQAGVGLVLNRAILRERARDGAYSRCPLLDGVSRAEEEKSHGA